MSHRLGHVVVVGASLAGTRAVETLRAEGYEGRVTLVGEEPCPPYDRPPLSKQLLTGDWEPPQAALGGEEHFERLDVELVLGTAASGLDRAGRAVELGDGRRLPYDAVVLATGARARRLPGRTPPGVHTLRTLDDCLAIRAACRTGPRVVVVGGGFIGAEVAASARAHGLDVTLVDPLPTPMARVLGTDLGRVCAELHADHGVSVRCSAGVAELRGGSRVEQVVLSDGSVIPADLVVVGVGVVPNTEWLGASGLALRDGVLCDEHCAADEQGRVYAAGDVARWWRRGRSVRVEHWTNAVEQARHAVRNLLAGPRRGTPYDPIPYFWSDQHGVKIQMVGSPGPDDRMEVVSGSPADRRFVAVSSHAGHPTAAIAFNAPRELARYRGLIAAAPAPA
ncbi:NAD(P)/FAD-dependent oxidoreductase [Streptosporangium sp. NPDC087985]|uniref:NAD(P)/FAD-dependent oxidoreductase n=1 Tax=Streptosporangium sp. NPDC087985 TaxID=3366196 RepID=UPI003819FEAC